MPYGYSEYMIVAIYCHIYYAYGYTARIFMPDAIGNPNRCYTNSRSLYNQ